jgi:shikimate dehydrogenase
MHNAALEAVGLTGWRYQLLPIALELLDQLVPALPDAGFRGANVTIPHKERSLELAHGATTRARAIGAANTLVFDAGGAIHADNTDAPALIEALPFSAQGASALVLGAGGSARAAVWALLDAGAREVRVWNRNPKRARGLVSEVGGVAVDDAGPADLLVHCTPVGLDGRRSPFKELPLTADELRRYRCVVDLVYTERETVLIETARGHGIPTVDGLELLVGQGVLSFELFTGIEAPRAVMRAAVR